MGATREELVAIRVTRQMITHRVVEYCALWAEAKENGWLGILMTLQEPLSNLVCLTEELSSMEQLISENGSMLNLPMPGYTAG